jgi:hypothetical protein
MTMIIGVCRICFMRPVREWRGGQVDPALSAAAEANVSVVQAVKSAAALFRPCADGQALL